MKPATGPLGEAPASHVFVMVIVTGISDRWTSWKIGPRRLLIDEKRLWKQDFFFDPARTRLDVRRGGHPNIRSHKRGLEAAPS